MDKEEFRKQYLGDFKPDQRGIDLHERLADYYRNTPDSMVNREAMQRWREFKRWCIEQGYTKDEINQAKRNAEV